MIFIKLLTILLITLLISCSENQDFDSHNHPKLTTGEKLFNYHCTQCHTKKGGGNFLEGIPPNVLTGRTKKMVLKKIHVGEGINNSMPVYKNMPQKEAVKIVEHLFYLKNKFLMEKLHKK